MLQVVKEGWRVHPPNFWGWGYMGASQSRDTLRNFLRSLASPGLFLWRTWETVSFSPKAVLSCSSLCLDCHEGFRNPFHLSILSLKTSQNLRDKSNGVWDGFCSDLGVTWSWPCFHTAHFNFTLGYKIVLEIILEKINNRNLRSHMLYKVHVRCEVGVFPAMGRYLEWPFAAKTSKMLCTVFRQNLLVRMRGYLFLLLQ